MHGREAGFMDLSPLLYVPDTGSARRNVLPRNEVVPLDRRWATASSSRCWRVAGQSRTRRCAWPTRSATSSARSGTRLSGQLALRYGDAGLSDGQIRITFTGTAGQSFRRLWHPRPGADLMGEANDYVGKGLGGGEIVIRPTEEARFVPHQNVILGNTALYGATGGKLFAAGVAGERFAVRNSGATAVVEGAGEHCCEYMTGGTVVVLGETGRNFGAGMTGGQAFVYDVDEKFEQRYNTELIAIARLTRRRL